jgi:hypothetical protein
MRVTVFLEYTERYAKIMQNMPYQARDPDSDYRLSSQPSDERHRILAILREYLTYVQKRNGSTIRTD